MKTSQKKVAQVTKEQEEDEQRRMDKQKRDEENKQRRKEEDQELSRRRREQRVAAEEVTRKLVKKKGNQMLGYYVVFGLLGALTLYVIVMMFLNQQAPLHKTPVIDDTRIEEHNHNYPWQQGGNKLFEGATLADAKRLINSSFASHSNLNKCNSDDSVVPPESFDAREQWPTCVLPTANQQITCGSSYAISIAQTIAERVCIQSKTKKLIQLSAQELLSCDDSNQGCKGGYLNNALDYIRKNGLVDEQCFPYQADSDTVKCEQKCVNPTRERIDGYCVLFGEDDIKKEIMKNGPVVAASQVHIDYLTYKSGVYTKSEDVARFSGYQSIKIVGWGVESGSESEPNKGNKYWIVQNSWGEDWGEHGYSRVSMGQELMFDQYAYSIKVKADRTFDFKTSDAKPTASNDDSNIEDLEDTK